MLAFLRRRCDVTPFDEKGSGVNGELVTPGKCHEQREKICHATNPKVGGCTLACNPSMISLQVTIKVVFGTEPGTGPGNPEVSNLV